MVLLWHHAVSQVSAENFLSSQLLSTFFFFFFFFIIKYNRIMIISALLKNTTVH